MFRFVVVLAFLVGFLFAQTSAHLGSGKHLLSAVKKSVLTQASSQQESPDCSGIPVSCEDEEESDSSSSSDCLKFLVSQIELPLSPAPGKTRLLDSHFHPWSLSFDIDRPPKSIS